MSGRRATAALAAAMLVGLGSAAAQQPGEIVARTALRVCADPNNLPFSNEAGEGYENKIAAILGQELKLPVEYVFFPAGVRHVFCYGLYVTPPPTSGTITIQKQVTGAPAGDNPQFPFNGSISYDPSGFQLGAGGSEDFYRAGGVTWTVTESTVANYKLAGLSCSAEAAGASTSGVAGASVSGAAPGNGGRALDCVAATAFAAPLASLVVGFGLHAASIISAATAPPNSSRFRPLIITLSRSTSRRSYRDASLLLGLAD